MKILVQCFVNNSASETECIETDEILIVDLFLNVIV